MPQFRRVESKECIERMARLAAEIWNEHYVSIIGQAQVDYMVEKFQGPRAIAEQIAGDYEYYLIEQAGDSVGYLALVPQPDNTMLLSKIYVRSDARGRGLGRAAVEFAEQRCRQRNISTLWLTVNKHNSHSIDWYEHIGFENVGPIVQDIGHGFVMDDYKMQKPVSPRP